MLCHFGPDPANSDSDAKLVAAKARAAAKAPAGAAAATVGMGGRWEGDGGAVRWEQPRAALENCTISYQYYLHTRYLWHMYLVWIVK